MSLFPCHLPHTPAADATVCDSPLSSLFCKDCVVTDLLCAKYFFTIVCVLVILEVKIGFLVVQI